MRPVSGWKEITVDRRHIPPVSTLHTYKTVKVHWGLSRRIVIKKNARSDMPHSVVRDKPFLFKRPTRCEATCAVFSICTQQHPHPVKKWECESAGVVSRGCDNYPAETEAVPRPAIKHKTKKVQAGKQVWNPVQYTISTEETTQEAVETPTKKIGKRPDERYKDVLALLNTSKVSHFRTRTTRYPYRSDWIRRECARFYVC